MVCEDTALTCAVRELNETLQTGPALFEWLVPTLVSLATLVVALLSYWVSRRATAMAARATAAAEMSNELAQQVLEDSRRSALRQERDRFAEELSVWVEKQARVLWVEETRFDSSNDRAAATLERSRILAGAVTLDSPHGVDLVASLETLFAEALKRGERSDWANWFRTRAEFRIRGWQQDPERSLE